MSGYERRLKQLEARRRTAGHVIQVAYYQWHLGEPDEAWRQHLRCPCGRLGCPELRVGCVMPAKAPSAESWAARARQYQEGRDHG